MALNQNISRRRKIPSVKENTISLQSGFLGGEYSIDGKHHNLKPVVVLIAVSGTLQEGQILTIVVSAKNNSRKPVLTNALNIYRGLSKQDVTPVFVSSPSGSIVYQNADNSMFTITYTYTVQTADVGKYLKFSPAITLDSTVNNLNEIVFSDYTNSIVIAPSALDVYNHRRLQIETITVDGSSEGWSGWSEVANGNAVVKGTTSPRLNLNGGSLTKSSFMDFLRANAESLSISKGTIGEVMEFCFVVNFPSLAGVNQTILSVSGTSSAYVRLGTTNNYQISGVTPSVSPTANTWAIVRIRLDGANSFIQINNGSKTIFNSGAVSWAASVTSMFFGSSNAASNYATMKMRFFGNVLSALDDANPTPSTSPWGLAYTKLNTEYMGL
jgi:hypothetical protein